MSTVTLSKPHCATISAEKLDGIASQAFTTALPEAQICLTLLFAMKRVSSSFLECQLAACWMEISPTPTSRAAFTIAAQVSSGKSSYASGPRHHAILPSFIFSGLVGGPRSHEARLQRAQHLLQLGELLRTIALCDGGVDRLRRGGDDLHQPQPLLGDRDHAAAQIGPCGLALDQLARLEVPQDAR